MKFKIEVDEDYERSCSFDEELRNKIIQTISDKVKDKIFDDSYIAICDKITDKVDTYIDQVLVSFINRRIVITDKWGDKLEEHENVYEMLKAKFDEFITQPVNNHGEPITKACSHRNGKRRVDYIIKKASERQILKFTNDTILEVKCKLDEMLKESLQTELSDTIFKTIDVEKLLRGF